MDNNKSKLEQNIDYVKSVFSQVAPELMNANQNNSGLTMIIVFVAIILTTFETITTYQVNNMDPQTSDIDILERGKGQDLKVVRQQPEKAVVRLTITCNIEGVEIQKDKDIFSNGKGINFTPKEDGIITLHKGDNIVVCENVETGYTDIEPNTIKHITSNQIEGIESINNPVGSTISYGRDLESDASYRSRVIIAFENITLTQNSKIFGLINECGCSDANIIYNNDTYKSIEWVAPGSIGIICYGGDQQKILNYIMSNFSGNKLSYLNEEGKYVGDLVYKDGYTIGNIYNIGTQCDVVYTLAQLEEYYLKINVIGNPDLFNEETCKDYIIKYIQEKKIEKLGHPLDNTIITSAYLQQPIFNYLQENNLANIFTLENVEMSLDNVNWRTAIKASKIENLLHLSKFNITFNYD